jgi:death-on-curing protein
MIRFVPRKVVLTIHADQINEFGGSPGLRDANLLDSAISQPQARFGDEYLYTSRYELAAADGFHLRKNHSFLDGNKRTACMVMVIFLRLHGFVFSLDAMDASNTMMAVAEGNMSKRVLALWLERMTFPPPLVGFLQT